VEPINEGSARHPQLIGKYPISGILGKGAMGIVYKAFHPVIKRAVAIKTIRRDLADDDDRAAGLVARFRQEAEAGGRLEHPAIVRVYDYGEDDDVAYIVMEYVEGNTLRRYFQRGMRFEEADVVSVMVQLLDALAFAHNHGVWHRDVKPANIIIMGDGRLKIADFGIARISASTLTQVGSILGTPGFMAPEQYRGGTIDCRIDIFSAGVVFYQLLSGISPFSGPIEALVHKVCNEEPTPPSALSGLDHLARFDAVVAKALAKKADDRFPSAQSFKEAILEAYARPANPTIAEETILHDVARSPYVNDPSNPLSSATRPPSTAPIPTVPAIPTSAATRVKSTAAELIRQAEAERARTEVAPAQGAGTDPSSAAIARAGWDPAVLAAIEERLRRFVGPIATPMVRRAAAKTPHVSVLVRLVADQLNDPRDREGFLRASALGDLGPTPRERPAVADLDATQVLPQEPVLTAAELERCTRSLAVFLGPIASIVCKRAAKDCISVEDFHQAVARQISTPRDRERFLRDLSRLNQGRL
jgi:eukaryotic-like serine/threonine-protein kinase